MFRQRCLMIALIAMTICLSGCSMESGPEEAVDVASLKQRAVRISYDDLARYADMWEGTAVRYQGKVLQLIGETALRVNITRGDYGLWSDAVYLDLQGRTRDVRLLEDDIIQFVGIASGTRTYRAVLGNRITLPYIRVYEIRLLFKRGEEIRPITESEAKAMAIGSSYYQNSLKRYGDWWKEFSGSELSNIEVTVARNSFPDNIERWQVTTCNLNGDPNVRTQYVISSILVDEYFEEMLIYSNAEGILMPIN